MWRRWGQRWERWWRRGGEGEGGGRQPGRTGAGGQWSSCSFFSRGGGGRGGGGGGEGEEAEHGPGRETGEEREAKKFVQLTQVVNPIPHW